MREEAGGTRGESAAGNVNGQIAGAGMGKDKS